MHCAPLFYLFILFLIVNARLTTTKQDPPNLDLVENVHIMIHVRIAEGNIGGKIYDPQVAIVKPVPDSPCNLVGIGGSPVILSGIDIGRTVGVGIIAIIGGVIEYLVIVDCWFPTD